MVYSKKSHESVGFKLTAATILSDLLPSTRNLSARDGWRPVDCSVNILVSERRRMTWSYCVAYIPVYLSVVGIQETYATRP